MDREGIEGWSEGGRYLLSILFFSFIIKFSFDLNRRKREMGRGMGDALGLIEER